MKIKRGYPIRNFALKKWGNTHIYTCAYTQHHELDQLQKTILKGVRKQQQRFHGNGWEEPRKALPTEAGSLRMWGTSLHLLLLGTCESLLTL